MISLIICSRQIDISVDLKQNISKTIGIGYELILIDNSKNRYSIFEAYNIGVSRAKYPYLCFMHEDIEFHTIDWGRTVIDHFQESNVGLIGVVGGHYMPDCPASWWSTECKSGEFIQVYSSLDKATPKKIKHSWTRYKQVSDKSISVAAVDGLWFCISKSLFEKIRFDDITFKGFHCYDLDICMQIQQLNYDVRVVFDILIEHYSGGNHDLNLVLGRELFYNKWKSSFPIKKGITLNDFEIEDRGILANNIHILSKDYLMANEEIKRILNSKAYRFGKFFLRPLSFIQSKFLNRRV
jgi:hypothetical protein